MTETKFKLLSLREERKLSESDLKQYYSQLREYVLDRKLKTTTKGAITVAPKLKPYVNKLDSFVTKILAGGEIERITDGLENIPDGPVLFACAHQGLLDNLCWIPSNPRHSVLLHAADVDKFLIWIQMCTGLVLVDKNAEDPTNRTDAKLDMIHILLKGHTVWYYPEGAWNLSPNKLHLPMSFGFLDVAKKAGVPVVPVVIEYTYDTSTEKEKITKMHIRYGKPISVDLCDDLTQKLEEYFTEISTIRWELLEEKGLFERSKITNWDYINFLKGNLKNLAMKNKKVGARMIDMERHSLRGSGDDFYLFHHINDVPFNEDGELLDTEESIRLARLFDEHVLGIKSPVKEG